MMAAVDSKGPTVFGWVLLAILAAGAAVGVWFLRRRARGNPAKATRQADTTTPSIRARIVNLMALRQLDVVPAAAGDRMALAVIG